MTLIYDGKKITALREGKGWNQAELAKAAKLAQPSLWALEHEVTKKPKYETLERVAGALGVPVRAILRDKPKGNQAAHITDDMLAAFEALSEPNRIALLAAAQALLDSQKRR